MLHKLSYSKNNSSEKNCTHSNVCTTYKLLLKSKK